MTSLVQLFAEREDLWLAMAATLLVGVLVGVLVARLRPGAVRGTTSAERSLYLRGVNYILSNDTDAAIEELTRVVQVSSETVETYFALGALFRSKGEVERAIRIHQSLVGRSGLDERTRTQALFELGCDYKKAGLVARAVGTFEEVLARQPSFVDAHRELQRLYEDAGDWEKAYAAQKQVVRLTGRRADSVLSHLMVEIGRTHEEKGELKEARACYRRALGIDAASVHAYLALADLAMREGNGREALGHFQRALRENPSLSGLIYPRLHEAYRRLGEPGRHEAFLRQQVVQDEYDIFARLALAQLLAGQHRTREAIEELRRALELKPDFVEARKELGEILLASGSADELRREYDDLLSALVRPMKSLQCRQCGFETSQMDWKCPQCQRWDTIGYKRFRREKRSRLRVA